MIQLIVLLAIVPLLVTSNISFNENEHEISSYSTENESIEKIVHAKSDKSLWFAKAKYQPTFSSKGWDILHIETNPSVTDAEQAFFAGFIEGVVTQGAIYKYWYNTVHQFCKSRERFCEQANDFIFRNIGWTRKTIQPHQFSNDPFWHQVDMFIKQLHGMHDGYNHCYEAGSEELTFRDILWLNLMTEIETLKSAFNVTALPDTLIGSTHCSGLIKLLPDYEDLLVSHVTWTGYHNMLRIIKRYDFNFHTASNKKTLIPGSSMAFTGYPGIITSVDDFYVIKSGLVILETTVGNSNYSLWELVQPTGQVSQAIRSMVAHRLSRSGREWAQIFSQYNNGLYNNQWLVVDMKKFVKGHQPSSGTLWVVEQSPGLVMSADQTHVLTQQLYWPSYNIPSYPEIFQRLGNEQLVTKFGEWFGYETSPRAKIFRRDHDKAKDIDSMLELMRSNNYKNDPYSRCNCTPPYSANNAISCRDDLNPKNGTYPFPALGNRNHGAIDAKVTNCNLSRMLQFKAISGPTKGSGLPPFQWSKSDFKNIPHLGQPDEFDFPPLLHNWENNI